jgi:DNA-binding FadR family transcriptional regulator
MLPTESELARQFGVNRSTVREALRRLESSGLVDRVNGGKRLLVIRRDPPNRLASKPRWRSTGHVYQALEAMLAIAPLPAEIPHRSRRALYCGGRPSPQSEAEPG